MRGGRRDDRGGNYIAASICAPDVLPFQMFDFCLVDFRYVVTNVLPDALHLSKCSKCSPGQADHFAAANVLSRYRGGCTLTPQIAPNLTVHVHSGPLTQLFVGSAELQTQIFAATMACCACALLAHTNVPLRTDKYAVFCCCRCRHCCNPLLLLQIYCLLL